MVEDLVLLLGAGGECLDDLTILAADQGLLRLCDRDKLPSPDAARSFLLGFHDENLLKTARSENPADEASVIYPESAALMGLARVQKHIVAQLSRQRPQPVAMLEMDATIIESHKKQAVPCDLQPAVGDEGAGSAAALRGCQAQTAALRRLQSPGSPGFARAQAAGPCRPESSGTRRFAARADATARRLGRVAAHFVPSSGPHGGLRPWSACRRQPSDFPGWACSECPATATATTTSTATTTFHWPAGGATSPWATAFRQAPRGLAALAAGLRYLRLARQTSRVEV